jgi:hypothetical protein
MQEYESLDYDPYDTTLTQRALASKPRSVWILLSTRVITLSNTMWFAD